MSPRTNQPLIQKISNAQIIELRISIATPYYILFLVKSLNSYLKNVQGLTNLILRVYVNTVLVQYKGKEDSNPIPYYFVNILSFNKDLRVNFKKFENELSEKCHYEHRRVNKVLFQKQRKNEETVFFLFCSSFIFLLPCYHISKKFIVVCEKYGKYEGRKKKKQKRSVITKFLTYSSHFLFLAHNFARIILHFQKNVTYRKLSDIFLLIQNEVCHQLTIQGENTEIE